MNAIISIILSIITAVTAIIAIVISIVEMRKSNKQSLFERRLNAYLKVLWMKKLCEANKTLKDTYLDEGKNCPILELDFIFCQMTNCADLEEIQGTLQHLNNSELKRKFLLKIELLRNLCEEVKLIFPENIGYPLSDFVFYYEEMLFAMYRYQITLEKLSNDVQDSTKPLPCNNSIENACRWNLIKYLSGTFEISERLWKDGTLRKATKQIKL